MLLFKYLNTNISKVRMLSTATVSIRKKQKKSKRISREMNDFFNSSKELSETTPHIPVKYMCVNSTSEHHYLVCTNTAKEIIDKIMPHLDLSRKQLICETNAGLGLLTMELLERGVKLVRMYESCSEFRAELKDFGTVYPKRVELFTKDIFHINRYAYMDKIDRLGRVENLFTNVPSRSWTDEPVMSIIGAMNGFLFLQYLVRSLALQILPSTHGRIQTFALLKAKDYTVLTATNKDSPRFYRKFSVLFSLMFDIELLGVFPKKLFVPWEKTRKIDAGKKVDSNKRYLVKINSKKDIPIETEKLVHFIYFIHQFYKSGNSFVIPTVEKWLPGSGANLIYPQVRHKDFYGNFSIFTKFKELTPDQLVAVFKEINNHPGYSSSSFLGMVQNELMQSETVSSDIADVEFESKLLDDFAEKLEND